MKKLVTVILVCLMVICMPLDAAADGEYATCWDLVQTWLTGLENNYPEGVCGVWSTDGSMENIAVAVTEDEAGEQAKADILAAVADDSGLSFTTHKYSYARLYEAQGKISEYLQSYEGEETGVAAWGIYERENCVHVDLIVSKPGAEDFMRWGYENFGDMILFESVDGYPVPAAAELGVGEEDGKLGGIIAVAGACVVIVAAVLLLRRKLFPPKRHEA